MADQSDQSDQEDISRRAYERFQERGGEHGRDQEDWLEAEREVRDRRGDSQKESTTPPRTPTQRQGQTRG